MTGIARLLCIAAAAFGAAAWLGQSTPAVAGAWTQAPGAGQVIASVGRRGAPVNSFVGGPSDEDSTFVSLFFEYGLAEGLTIGGTGFVEFDTSPSGANTADIGLFLRQRLWQGREGDVAAVQVGIKQPIDDLLGDDFGGPNADPMQEVSLRLLYGRGWGLDWGSAFVSLEGGYHLQTDGDDDELRADVTIGAQPWDCCMLLLSSFSTYPIGDSDEAAVKIAPSVTYSFGAAEGRKPVTLQIGISQDLLDLDEGPGVQIGVWRPF
jgi:hypothetical protein